jgi:predicted phosphate transport protein (TIGR00153 family)
MAILSNLFGESPFGVLEAHGKKVHECVRMLQPMFAELGRDGAPRLREIADQIFALETEADRIRNHLHELLANKTLLPMRRDDLFQVLEAQDSMADRAEDIAATMTLRELKLPESVLVSLVSFAGLVLGTCELAAGIISKLDLLVESSFSGRDAVTVSRLITELAEREDEVKPRQIAMSRELLAIQPRLDPVETILWLDVVHFLAELSKAAAHTAAGIRLTLQIKANT